MGPTIISFKKLMLCNIIEIIIIVFIIYIEGSIGIFMICIATIGSVLWPIYPCLLSSMWMWLLVKISIYHTFIASLLKKLIFWYQKFQINHMVSKYGSIYFHLSWKVKIIRIIFGIYLCFWIHIYTTFVSTNIFQSPTL